VLQASIAIYSGRHVSDLEGIVAKRKFDPYLLDNAKWYKIRNRNYSQGVGREELFERERSIDPNWHYWNVCTSASDQLVTMAWERDFGGRVTP